MLAQVTQVTNVRLSYLIVGLDMYRSVTGVLEAGLVRQVHTKELSSIAAHALLRW